MQITRVSMFTGIEHTMDLPVTQDQLDNYYRGGDLLQNAFPQLNADQREFIKTGVTPEEWKDVFGTDDEDDNGYGELDETFGDHVED